MENKYEFERFLDDVLGEIVLCDRGEKQADKSELEQKFKDISFSVNDALRILEDDRYIHIERIDLPHRGIHETGNIILTDKGLKDYSIYYCMIYESRADRETKIDKSFEHTEQSFIINKRVLNWAKLAVYLAGASIVATIIGYFINNK